MRFRITVERSFLDSAISELPPFGEQDGKTARVRLGVPSGGYGLLKMADRDLNRKEGTPSARTAVFPAVPWQHWFGWF